MRLSFGYLRRVLQRFFHCFLALSLRGIGRYETFMLDRAIMKSKNFMIFHSVEFDLLYHP